MSEIRLRPMRLTDIPWVAAMAHENADHIGRFMARPQQDVSHHVLFLTQLYLASERGERQEFVIERDGIGVGRIGLQRISGRDRDLEIYIWVARVHSGAGVGRAALHVVCDLAAESSDVDRLWCRIWQGNHASRRIFEAVGFTFDQTWPTATSAEGMWIGTRAV